MERTGANAHNLIIRQARQEGGSKGIGVLLCGGSTEKHALGGTGKSKSQKEVWEALRMDRHMGQTANAAEMKLCLE